MTARGALLWSVLALGALWLVVAPATPAGAVGESINARLLNDTGKGTKPVRGVRIVVRQGATKIGEDRSDATGLATIPVPGPGTYQVILDTSTIPKGLALANPDQTRLPNVIVRPGRPAFVVFPFGQGVSGGPGTIDELADLTASGVRFGLIIALSAVGLSLVYGATGLINFAQGELVTFGGIAAYYFNSHGDGLGITLVVAGLLAVIAGGCFGASLDVVLWRPLRRRRSGTVSLIVVSIGLALFLRSAYQVIFGANPRSYDQYAIQRAWHLGPLDILPRDVASIGIALVLLVTVGLLLLRTRLGTAVRAVTDNGDLAESSGIDVQGVIRVVWVACGALTAASGVLLGLTDTVQYDMGFRVLLVTFAAVILGGLGTAFGAMVGGVLLGVVTEVSTYWIPVDFKFALALGVLIVVLLMRPQGILGVRERIV